MLQPQQRSSGRFWSLVATRRRIIVELRSQRCGSVAKLASKTPPESLLAASLSLPFLSYGTIYRELERTILGANTQEDLKWFSNNHGPGMHMNWPAFEVRRRASTQGLLLSVDFALFNPSRTPHPPGIQPRPGQRSSKEEEARRRPTHPQHRPRGATW